jgi:hypothetical protein
MIGAMSLLSLASGWHGLSKLGQSAALMFLRAAVETNFRNVDRTKFGHFSAVYILE